jgi:P pilus assembly chaperone PapD
MEIVFTVPSLDMFIENKEDSIIPGELKSQDGNLILNAGREAVSLKVVNNGDRPIQVFSRVLRT